MIRARIRKQFPAGRDSAGFTLDVDLQAGSAITVLFGPSGSGKTLALDCIAGFVRPDEGRIMLDDDILFDGATGVHVPARNRRCGYVFQNYALFPHMTLRQNLQFAAERLPRLERHRKVNEMIEKFRLGDVPGRRPHQVSGGQKQRCSIARALIASPRFLLLDEPARGLDAPLREELYSILREVRADFRIPVLLVTHDLDEGFQLGDEMLVVRDGRIVQSGPPRTVIEQPASVEVARLLGLYNLLPVEIKALDPSRNSSRLRYKEFDLTGLYIPGHLIGDKVWMCIRRDEVRAMPREGKPGPNQIPATLENVIDRPGSLRLDFAEDLAAEMPHAQFNGSERAKEWLIEFPPASLRVI
ncbi:MAG TPA: ATP-binding cassette domain-containing protein [Bryobacteraceae bacterium]|nr:ATP-binding cassette domain-containing protein [Bryobacteraceae bacterium]